MSNISIPPISWEDLQNFQSKHFPIPSTLNPSQSQTQTQTQTRDANEPPNTNINTSAPANTNGHQETEHTQDDDGDDDDLGYYADGVKRTLTDEQIRIFRHSEIHALLRERQIRKENEEYERAYGYGDGTANEPEAEPEDGAGAENNSEEGLKGHDNVAPAVPDSGLAAGKKRPADDAGPGSGSRGPAAKKHSTDRSTADGDVQLNYNEETVAGMPRRASVAPPPFMGRRIISYED